MFRDQVEEHDPHFLADLRESQRAVWRVAQWLHARGLHVTVRALRERPTVEDVKYYADSGDIEIVQRIEVKHRHLTFTCAEDYPYPTVTVDVAHAWDRACPKPQWYVILNEGLTHAAVVSGRSADQWVRVSKEDRAKQRVRTFYECPLALVCFRLVPHEE